MIIIPKNFTDSFFEDFKNYSMTSEMYKKPDGTWTWKTHSSPKIPALLLNEYTACGTVFAICPVYNGMTNLIWWDIDAHSKDEDEIDKHEAAANKLYNTLTNLGYSPEFSQSSLRGNYHIKLRIRESQEIGRVHKLQKRIIRSLLLTGVRVDIGPNRRRSIRPFWCGNEAKPVGALCYLGETAPNLDSLYRAFPETYHIPEKSEKTKTPTNSKFSIDVINSCIPDGTNLTRNKSLLKLVRVCKSYGLSDESILECSEYIYRRGKVKDSLDTHQRECQRILDGYDSKKNADWGLFWNTLPAGLDYTQMLSKIRDFANCNSLIWVPLSIPALSSYWKVSETKAWKRRNYMESEGWIECIGSEFNKADMWMITI